MSESVVRKIQPFTIGTRLSVPTAPKCPELMGAFLPSRVLDTCKAESSTNQVSFGTDCPQVHVAQVAEAESVQEEVPTEDGLGSGALPQSSASRSIRKIHISGSTKPTGDVDVRCPTAETSGSEDSYKGVCSLLPKITEASCHNRSDSPFKGLLRKNADSEPEKSQSPPASGLQCLGDRIISTDQGLLLRSRSPTRGLENRNDPVCSNTGVGLMQNDCSITQRNTFFNREVLQAEQWIDGKLQDLKDGYNTCWASLQDWEKESQTLQRDLKDFENTLIQLNQMGEQLVCEQNPNADVVQKQLGQLRDHWHALKQVATKRAAPFVEAGNLHQGNRKVNKMEVWIKEKQEEQQTLAKTCRENADKIQLTRRILDLEQDEKNDLAPKLEKYWRTESKNITASRRDVSEMFFEIQSRLKDYHESLQLALEVSSFYQLADNIINAITNKSKSVSVTNDDGSSGDKEIRDIASQITMLDVFVSRLSSFHPTLAARLTHKQGEVKGSWTLLQSLLSRKEVSDSPSNAPALTREDTGPLGMSSEPQGGMENEALRILGKEDKEEQNRLKGHVSVIDPGGAWKSANDQGVGQFSESSATYSGDSNSNMDDVMGRSQREPEREKQMISPRLFLPGGKTSTDKEEQHEGQGQHPESTRIEEFFVQLELLWEELKKNQEDLVGYQDLEKLDHKVMEALKNLNDLGSCLQSVGTASVPRDPVSGAKEEKPILEGEMPLCGSEMNQPQSKGHLYMQQLWTRFLTEDEKYQSTLRTLKPQNLDPDHSDLQMALEESQGFLESGHGKVDQTPLDWINRSVSQSAMLSMDILDAERDMSIDREPDCARLEALQEQQDKLEMDYESIREELVKMGVLAERSEVTCPTRDQVPGEEVKVTLEAWEELDSSMAENQGHLRQLRQLQDFFCKYQAMILWPEFTQGRVFSGNAASSGDVGSELHMEQKSRQFQDLATAGQKLIDEGHHLTEMIQERTRELRTMLDWVRGHWSHRKQNSEPGRNATAPATSEIKPIQSEPHPPTEKSVSSHPSGGCHVLLRANSCDEGVNKPCSEPESKSAPTTQSPNTSPLQRETPKSPVFVLTEPAAPSLGGTVNLVLSFGESGGGQLQVHDVPEEVAASEPKHRVSAYLHVKEKQDSDLLLGTGSPTHIVSKAQVSICPSATACSQEVSVTPLRDTARCVSSSTFSTLKSKSEKRKKRSHRHTIQSMMGVDPEDLDIIHSLPLYSTHTWPLDASKNTILKARLANTDCLSYLKNPVTQDIVTKHKGDCFGSNRKIPSECDKSQYKYLPLGSTLSFDLPKDLGHIPSIPAVINIDLPETSGKNIFSNNVGQNLNTDRQEGLSTLEMSHSPSDHNREKSKSDKISKQKQMPLCQGPESQNCDLNLAPGLPPCGPLPEEEHPTQDHLCCTSAVSHSDTSDELSRLSGFHSPFEEANQNREKTLPLGLSSAKLNNNSQSTHVQNQDNQCNNKALGHTSNLFRVNHVCPSVHTKIQDLNGHIYHSPAMWLRGQLGCSVTSLTASSPASMSLKTSTTKKEDSADFGQHVKFTAGKVVGGPVPKATGEVVGSLEKEVTTVRKKDNCNSTESGNGVVLGAIHPDHGQFEEEEAELKDIWNRINGYNTCQGVREKLVPAPTTQSRKPAPPDQDEFCRKPVTVSTHNLLVAEFKLPASIQNSLGYNKEQNPGQENLTQREKASWPVKEQQREHTTLTHQSAFSLGASPSTDCHSTSWKTEEAIGENKINNNSSSLMNEEVHSMDGVLEMMRHSETAGKATWTTFRTLLLKESLYFYRHKKDIPESSAPELTLDLTDAECTTCPECTGRASSFCLRLGNGSKYLLSASSPFLMRKWMLKIQANSAEGQKKTQNSPSSFAKDLSLSMEPTPSSQTTCHCVPGPHCISSFTKHNGTCHASAREFGVMGSEKPLNPQDCGDMKTAVSRSDTGSTDQCHSLTGDSHTGPAHSYLSPSQGCPARSCPSHCFTSATYQKITPVAPPCGPSVGSSSYSVTLLIGDQPLETTGLGAQTLCPLGQWQEPSPDVCLEGSSTSLPGQRDESAVTFFSAK